MELPEWIDSVGDFMYVEHGMEGGVISFTLAGGGGAHFDAQLIPVVKNLTLLFFVIIFVFRMNMKDMALTGEVPYQMNPQSHQVSLFLRLTCHCQMKDMRNSHVPSIHLEKATAMVLTSSLRSWHSFELLLLNHFEDL